METIESFDEDADGIINFKEFSDCMHKLRKQQNNNRIKCRGIMEILIRSAKSPTDTDYTKSYQLLQTYNIMCGEIITDENIIDIVCEDRDKNIMPELLDAVKGKG